jgi:hypothetical protein
VEITGRNGQGKTSILDAIFWALAGDKVVQDKPVREGVDKGTITVDLGAYKIVRTFKVKDDGTVTKSITVTNADGFKASNPQEILKGLVGDLTFDPLSFARMKPIEQVKTLRSLVPGFDFEANDMHIKTTFDLRTDTNRRIAQLKALINDSVVPADAPESPVSLSALTDELQAALDHNSSVDRLERQQKQHKDEIAETQDEIAELKSQLLEKEQYLETLLEVDLGDIPERQNIDVIRERISGSEAANALHAQRVNHDNLVSELKAEEDKAETFTTRIDLMKQDADKAVRSAQLPIDGLEITEDSILLNGQPFSQASDAEQLRASVAIAGAMNPTLRIIRVRDGSLLDSQSMALLAGYAELHGLQVWVESVDSSRPTAIIIEDGHVVGQIAEAAE